MKFTLKQMEVFVAVARTGSVSKAAKELFMTQSAASMALAELENQLSLKLFNRDGRALLLNEPGKVFLPRAIEILERAQEAQDFFHAEKDTITSSLQIVANGNMASFVLPYIISEFAKAFPQVNIKSASRDYQQIVDEIYHFSADVGFITRKQFRHPELEAILLRKEPMVLVASPKHPLAKKKKISKEDLINSDWVVCEPGSAFIDILTALDIDDYKIRARLELTNREFAKHAIKQGLGIGCLARMVVADDLKDKTLVELKMPVHEICFNLYAVVHKNRYKSEALKAFLDICRQQSNILG